MLDAGATEEGRPYFVMELVRGIRITDFCDKGRLTVPQRLELFVLVCQAVQHAHQKGIIHRDIKPSNILVGEEDETPVPKVIDFGIAKATAEVELTDKTLHTQAGFLLGTPAYMSPEQVLSGGVDIDTRSDVYALGVLLYELLTGRPPFEEKDLLRAGLETLRRTIGETEPARPSTRLRQTSPEVLALAAAARHAVPSRLVSGIQGDLDWIVLKALEKERTRRYKSAGALALDVRRHLRHEPIAARPPSARYTFVKWTRRHRGAFLGSAAVVAALLLGVMVSAWQAIRATRAEREQRELRVKSDDARREATLRAYAADMKAASVAIADGNLGQANALLDRYAPAAGGSDVRGFEWALLRKRATGDEIASFDHTGINGGVALAPDGAWVAAGVKFGDVRVWETATGKLLHTFPALKKRGPHRGVAISPDGTTLAYLSDDSIWVRGTARWEVLREIPAAANAVAFSPDGRLVWANERGLHFVNAQTFTEEFDLPGVVADSSTLLSFTSDGAKMGVLAKGLVFEIWDVAEKSRLIRHPVAGFASAVLSPDGKFAALGTREGHLHLWDVAARKEIARTEAHATWLLDAAFSADSKRLVTAGGDQSMRMWDLTATEPLAADIGRWRGHWNEVWTVQFSRDEKRLITGGKDAKVKLWNAEPPRPRILEVPIPGDAVHGGFSEDGAHFRIKLPDRIQFRSVQDGRVASEWMFPADYPRQHPHFSGDHVLMVTAQGGVAMHALPSGDLVRGIGCDGARALAVAGLSRDARIVATVRAEKSALDLWDFPSGQRLAEPPDYEHNKSTPATNRAAFSPDGRRVAYLARDLQVNIYDLEKRAVVHELKGFAWFLYCVACRRMADGSSPRVGTGR